MRTSLVHPPAVLATASSRGRRSGRCSAFHERIELRERRLCKERLQRSCAHAPSNAHILRVFGVNMSSQVKSSQVKTSHTFSPSSLLRASVCSVPSIADRSFGKTWLSKKVRSEHFFGDTVHEMLVKTNFPIVETRLVQSGFSRFVRDAPHLPALPMFVRPTRPVGRSLRPTPLLSAQTARTFHTLS